MIHDATVRLMRTHGLRQNNNEAFHPSRHSPNRRHAAGARGISRGTGFLVAEGLVLTALHWETYGFPDANPRDGMVNVGAVSNRMGTLEGNAVFQLFSQEAAADQGAPVKGLSGGPVVVKDAVVGLLRFALMTKEQQTVAAAFSLYMMFYNFGRVHQTLRITPAMAAGVSSHVWSIEEIVGLKLTFCDIGLQILNPGLYPSYISEIFVAAMIGTKLAHFTMRALAAVA